MTLLETLVSTAVVGGVTFVALPDLLQVADMAGEQTSAAYSLHNFGMIQRTLQYSEIYGDPLDYSSPAVLMASLVAAGRLTEDEAASWLPLVTERFSEL